MKKKTEKKRHPQAKGGKSSHISCLHNKSIVKEIEKSIPIGVLPSVLGRLPIFLPLSKAKKIKGKSILELDGSLSFIGQNKKIREIYIDGYILSTQEEDLLIFLSRKAVSQGRLVKTSYAEIARIVFGEKKLNPKVRKKIDELLDNLSKTEITIVESNNRATTFGFIADRQRKQDEDYRHPLFVFLRDIFFSMISEKSGFYLQNIEHRRKLRSPNLKRIYSFLCSGNFKQISLKKIYDNCRIKQRYSDFKRRTIQNPKLLQFLSEAKNCEIQVDAKKEIIVFISKLKAIKGGKNE